MDLKDLFEAIGAQAVKAAALKPVHPDAEPEHIYYLDGPEGPARVEAAPLPRDHKAGSLESFVEAVKTLIDDKADRRQVVWYSRNGAVCVLDDATRRDTVTLPLEPSPQMRVLAALEQCKPWKSQQEFVRLLRIDFAGCLGPSGNLLDIVRKVKFTTTESGGGEIAQGKKSMGRQLESELTGTAALPEGATFSVPVFASGFVFHGNAYCALEVDPQTQKFQLIPLPGSLENLFAEAEGHLGAELSGGIGDDALIYHGQP